jgi:hypothetical protein
MELVDISKRPDRDAILFVILKFFTIVVTLIVIMWKPTWLFPIIAINVVQAVIFAFWKRMWESLLLGIIVFTMVIIFIKYPPSSLQADILVFLYVIWNIHFTKVGAQVNGYVSSAAMNMVPALVYILYRLNNQTSSPTDAIWIFIFARCIIMIFASIHMLDPASCHDFIRVK